MKELAPGGHIDFPSLLKHGTSVKALSVKIGMIDTGMIIYRIIEDMCNSFNTYQPMSPAQMQDFADEIIVDLDWVTIEDVALFFDAIKKQRLGRVANRMDAGVIWDFWHIYASERNDAFYRHETQYKSNDIAAPRSNEVGNKISDAVKKIKSEWDKPNQ